MEAIKFENLKFAYPGCDYLTLDSISLSIEESQFIVLCGQSGCGKSTLLRHIKKNLTPYGMKDGDVFYYNQSIEALDDRVSASEIGFVQQNPDNQLVTDKVWHELAFGLESLGFDNATIKKKVAEMANFFGIHTWFRQDVNELSGGQKQLLNLASIMVMQPKVLILDEPTSQLDPIAASEFIKTLQTINQEFGTTIIISEHRLEELFTIADKVIVLENGKLFAYDSPDRIGALLLNNDDPKPLFYGLPAMLRIHSESKSQSDCPLTIKEAKLWIGDMVSHGGEKRNSEAVCEQDKCALCKTFENEEDDYILSLKDLSFRYDKNSRYILKDLNLNIKKGEIIAILGGNGAGKSTMLKVICNIVKPQEGKIKIFGQDLKKKEKKNTEQKIVMLPQNPQSLFTEVTVEEELLETIYHGKMADKEKIKKVNDIIDLLGLEQLRLLHPYDLSGGEMQKLALGKVLLLNPSVLLLDEPTKGIDPFFKMSLGKILKNLTAQGMTILMVSHDIEFCAEYSDRCGMFFDGEVSSVSEPREFFSGNNFYTTNANKIARNWKPKAITCKEVSAWIKTITG